MKETLVIKYWSLFVLSHFTSIVWSQPNKGLKDLIGCQQRSTSGHDYVGEANTTVDGIPCQRWSVVEPHDHSFTHVGDHNLCRNPVGTSEPQVWCYTTDPEHLLQNCSVPFCSPLKALDFSLDNDLKPDENNGYTHASLQRKNFPPSFTICTAFRVEAWTEYADPKLLVLKDDNGEAYWLWIKISAATTKTEFSFRFEDLPTPLKQSKVLFYPLQWTRLCLSKDSNTSLVRLVVDGELLVEQEVKVKSQPDNLTLC